MIRARAFKYNDPDYPIEISNGEGYGILLSMSERTATCESHGHIYGTGGSWPVYASDDELAESNDQAIRQQAARECADIVERLRLEIPKPCYKAGLAEARDAILRKFGIDEK